MTSLAIVVVGGDRRQRRDAIAALCKLALPGDRVVFGDSTTLRERRVEVGGESRRLETVAPREEEAVVFLDARVRLSTGGLEVLRDLIAASGALAVAARTNVADGDELIEGVPYRPGDEAALAAHLNSVRELAPATRAAELLVGPLLALSTEAAAILGGLHALAAGTYDPGTWSASVAAAGGRLLVAEGCYAHHPGGHRSWRDPRTVGRPFISACLIVKDEADNLERCLGSLAAVADEIVVYDTGSTDETRELAASLGARVIEGYWDDDFSRARNDALAHCRGQWILWLDADEELVLDSGLDLHHYLDERLSVVEGFIVLIDNLRGHETANALTHPACRLFRRAYGRWDGRVHEQIVARAGDSIDLVLALFERGRITHWGYLQQTLAGRDKGERNLRTAFSDLAGGSDLELAARLCSLGRSYAMAARYPEGVELCSLAADLAERPATKRLALRGAIEALCALERWDEAIEMIARLRAISRVQSLADLLEGHARLGRGEFELAEAHFRAVGSGLDDDGFEYGDHLVAAPLAETLFQLGRYGEAASTLLETLQGGGGLDAHLGLLVDAVERDERDLGVIADAIGPSRIGAYVPQLLQLQPAAADRALEAFASRFPGERSLLAAATSIAPALEVSRQLVWSHRLRSAGLPIACPLVAAARDERLPLTDRVVSAATALVAFGDARAHQLLVACLASAQASERAVIDAALGALGADLAALCHAIPPRPERAALLGAPGDGSDRDARRTLLLDDRPGRLRTSALAVRCARAGHAVTVVEPNPVDSVAALLNPLGVAVYGFASRGDDAKARRKSALQLLARLATSEHFDEVIVPASILDWADALRNLLPASRLILDADTDPLPVPAREEVVDLVLLGDVAASDAVDGPQALVVPASARDFLPEDPELPAILRRGVCLLTAGCGAPAQRVQGILEGVVASEPLLLLGDDPGGELGRSLPMAGALGPIADPTSYLRASRAAVVLDGPDAAHLLDAAARSHVPAFVLGEGDPSELREVLAALCSNVALFEAFAPKAGPQRLGDDRAPLPPLPPVRLAHLEAQRRWVPGGATPMVVRLVGDVSSHASLAQVNRALLGELARSAPEFVVTALDTAGASPTQRTPDGVRVASDPHALPAPHVEIRHQWPPDFRPLCDARLVLIQPWEFGGLPAEWIGPIRDVVDELWVPTAWVRDGALASGLEPNWVSVVPNGVDVDRFSPGGPRYPLRTRKAVKLLFVGGLIERKGIDALLEAYLAAFGRDDDVCLVVKPFGSNSVYRSGTLEPAVRRAASGDGAAIEIVDDALSPAALAALYRSCDVLVHPYRGEGFGLPIAEAMASGLPVVVSDGGAALDFCDVSCGWLVDARRVPVDLGELTSSVGGSWWLEPSRISLIEALRSAVGDPAERARRGAAARERIVAGFTWEAAAQVARSRLRALLGLPALELAHAGGPR